MKEVKNAGIPTERKERSIKEFLKTLKPFLEKPIYKYGGTIHQVYLAPQDALKNEEFSDARLAAKINATPKPIKSHH